MAYTSVRVVFEIGHEACVRPKKTEQGFTHDWQLYVRGADNSEIQHFVDKVVFHLHETFINPKRVIKESPFVIRESGYAGFELVVEIYFKNKPDPSNKAKYKYHLTLPELPGAPITNVVQQVYVFNNPSEDFRRRLIKGGGVGVGEESHSNHITNSSQNDNHKNSIGKSKHSPQDTSAIKKSKKENTPRNEEKLRKDDPFAIFGQPINTANIPFTSKSSSKQISDKLNLSDKQAHSSKSSKHNIPSHKDKDREKDKDRDKEKERNKEKHKSKDRDKEKDQIAVNKVNKEGSPSGSIKKDKNKDGKAKILKSSIKEEPGSHKKVDERVREKPLEKLDKDSIRSEKKEKEKKHKDDKKPKQKEKHKSEKTDAAESSADRTDKQIKEEKDEKKRKDFEKEEREKIKDKSLEQRSLNGIFGPVNGQSTNDTTKEEKHKHHKHKKDKLKKESRVDREEKREKSKESKETTHPSPRDAKDSPMQIRKPLSRLFEELSDKSDSDSSSLDEDVMPTKCTSVQIKEPILSSPEASRNDDAEESIAPDVDETIVLKKKNKKTSEERKKKRKSKNKEETSASKVRKYDTNAKDDKTNASAIAEQPLAREQPAVESLRQRSLSPVSETKFTDEYITKLKELQRKIMALEDNSGLQRIVQVVAETGQYEITTKTFDFDLCSLDESIVQRLLDFFVP